MPCFEFIESNEFKKLDEREADWKDPQPLYCKDLMTSYYCPISCLEYEAKNLKGKCFNQVFKWG